MDFILILLFHLYVCECLLYTNSVLFYVEKKIRYFDLFGKSKHMLALYITQARDNG